jgi:glycosyltransferase involved in cell wall biosynthesis
MPRIAYLYSRYPVVSQTFCDSEMLALESLGFDLEIVSLNAPPDSFRHERLDRLKAEMHYPPSEAVLEAKAASPEFQSQLGPLIADHDSRYGKSFKAATRARNAWHYAPLLKKLGVTHVHVHFANRATHTALFLKQLGFTFSFTAHAQDFMVDLGSDDLLREMVREAEFVVAVSDFSKGLLCKTCPESTNKITRIYNGIELDDFPQAQPGRETPLRLISIGRLIEFKGFQNLISALGLLKERGLAVEARIIGEGPLRGELETQIAEAGLSQNIHLLGVRSQEQIKAELAEAHAFVLPSIIDRKGASDILPTVITEAMACHLPVVSTRLAGIPEMVAEGETGFLVEPGDVTALADALQRMAAQPALRASLGHAGRARSEQWFALKHTAAELGRHFSEVLQRKPSAARQESPIVYFLNLARTSETQCLPDDPRLRLLAAKLEKPKLAAHCESLPDATVLESLWLRRPAWRQLVERQRDKLGESMSGEDFYLQARRAVWMAEALPRRGVQHLHAFRADAVVTVWLWHLLTGLPVSAAIEESPSFSRTALARILPDFRLVTLSDERLAGVACSELEIDSLHLKNTPSHREIRLGPLRLKLRQTAVAQDRKPLEQHWLDRIVSSLHV